MKRGLQTVTAFGVLSDVANGYPVLMSERANGTYLVVNKAWERLTGIPREQAIGRTAIELGAAREVLPLDRIAPGIFTPAKAQLP